MCGWGRNCVYKERWGTLQGISIPYRVERGRFDNPTQMGETTICKFKNILICFPTFDFSPMNNSVSNGEYSKTQIFVANISDCQMRFSTWNIVQTAILHNHVSMFKGMVHLIFNF